MHLPLNKNWYQLCSYNPQDLPRNYYYIKNYGLLPALRPTKYGLILLQTFVRKNNDTTPPSFFNLFVYLLCFIINAKYIWHGILEGIDFAQFFFFFFVMMKFVLLLVIVVLISSNHKNTSSYVSNRGDRVVGSLKPDGR